MAHEIMKSGPGRQLPESLQIHNVPAGEALIALAAQLEQLVSHMPLISDLQVDLSVDPITGKAALHFRACR